MKGEENCNNPGRRRFLYALGACSALSITGFFVGDDAPHPVHGTTASAKPQLADVKRSEKEGLLLLSGQKTVCAVNKTGEYIVDLLDGKSALPDICRRVAERFHTPYSNEMEVSVATFIYRLGMAGFLVSPYYVTFYEA
ncbi:MAG: PqqD family protein [Tannerellaceae bacterium]|nr:PqqD family protein [Tannerellaceae bacterium]